MKIRQLHRIAGLIFAPIIILVSATGILLLWRKPGVYGKETKDLLLGLHNWEIGADYIGTIIGLGLIYMAVTGLIILIQTQKLKTKRLISKVN